MRPKPYGNVLITIGLLMLIAIACVHAAPPHEPPLPPPTPAQIPTPPPPPPPTAAPPAPTSAPTSSPTAAPTSPPPDPTSPLTPAPSSAPTSAPQPVSPPPPPPGAPDSNPTSSPTEMPTILPGPTVLPTLPTINPTSNPTTNPGTDTSNPVAPSGPSAPAPEATGSVPATGQPTENPTSIPTLVVPTTQVAPTGTTTAVPGAIAGPAAGGGFSRLVEPAQPVGTPAPEIIPPVEIVTGNQPEPWAIPGPDFLKSSPPGAPSVEKDSQGEVAAAPSDSEASGTSEVLETLRGTAKNASAVTPASKIFPPMAVPAVAVTTGMAVALIGNIFWANLDKIFSSKIFLFLRDFMGENVLQRLDEYEARKRKVAIRDAKKTRLGLTHTEIIVALAGALLIGIASLVALREAFALNNIVLYVATGGVAITVHEMGHRFAAHHQDIKTEVKFWELGAIIMFFTGWFSGSVFAQPHRTVMEETEEPNPQVEGKISLAGPVVSLGLAVVTVPFLFLGGDISTIASVLLMMTLLVAVYHLMPFEPMDGKTIYHWNRNILIVTLVPLMAIYYYLFLV